MHKGTKPHLWTSLASQKIYIKVAVGEMSSAALIVPCAGSGPGVAPASPPFSQRGSSLRFRTFEFFFLSLPANSFLALERLLEGLGVAFESRHGGLKGLRLQYTRQSILFSPSNHCISTGRVSTHVDVLHQQPVGDLVLVHDVVVETAAGQHGAEQETEEPVGKQRELWLASILRAEFFRE